jgi:hypothetical protein
MKQRIVQINSDGIKREGLHQLFHPSAAAFCAGM